MVSRSCLELAQVLDLADRDFSAPLINLFKELKENTFKALKENRTLILYIDNLSKCIEHIKEPSGNWS